MDLPRITVVTPSFNQGRFLERALRSVLDQGYPNLEYIVMDGGSSDNSVEILRQQSDQLTYWQSASDDGQGGAILDGWDRGSGDLITWLNSDDILLPGSLEIAAQALKGGADVIVGESISIDENEFITGYRTLWPGPTWMYRAGLLGVGQPGTFYRRDLAADVGYFDRDLRFSMEHDLMLNLLAAGATMFSADRPLAALRIYADTKTSMNPDAIAYELDGVYSKHIGGPLSIAPIRRTAISIERYVYATRYLRPANLWKLKQKLRWRRNPTQVKSTAWQRFL